jgi:hypothetical protein
VRLGSEERSVSRDWPAFPRKGLPELVTLSDHATRLFGPDRSRGVMVKVISPPFGSFTDATQSPLEGGERT